MNPKTIQDHDGKNAWQFSVDTTRQAFWKMVEKGEMRKIPQEQKTKAFF